MATLEEKIELIESQRNRVKKLKSDLKRHIEKTIFEFFDFRDDKKMISFLEENAKNEVLKKEINDMIREYCVGKVEKGGSENNESFRS